jgi:DNA-binding FadR family transcriptional regulator
MTLPSHMSWQASEKAMSSHDQIARVLGVEILSGAHPPGLNMPSEPDLLARFQVSRTVLREVMKTLAAKGLIVSKTRVGTKVLDPVNWNFFDAEVLSWKLSVGMDEPFRQHLAEVRRALEPRAAALAAERRTAADLTELRRCLALMRSPKHSARSFAETDLEFHLAVGAASGNPMLRSVAAVIRAALLASFSLSSPTERPELLESTVDAHKAIVDAIEARDPNAAASAMLNVIEVGFDRIQSQTAAKTAAIPKKRRK